jgi:hypothetical protein
VPVVYLQDNCGISSNILIDFQEVKLLFTLENQMHLIMAWICTKGFALQQLSSIYVPQENVFLFLGVMHVYHPLLIFSCKMEAFRSYCSAVNVWAVTYHMISSVIIN